LEQKELRSPTVSEPSSGGGKKEGNLLDWEEDSSSSKPVPTSSPSVAPAVSSGLDILSEIFGSGPISPAAPASVVSPSLLGISSPATAAPARAADPLDFLTSLTATPAAPAATSSPSLLGDLASLSSPVLSPVTPISTPVATPTILNGPLPTQTVYQKNGITIYFDIVKQASHPNITVVNASFTSSLPAPVQNFEFKAAVPTYIKLQVNPPSGNVLPPNNSGKATQGLKLMNTAHGEVIHFSYMNNY
jgi:AP-1 complex subunit gamma-1